MKKLDAELNPYEYDILKPALIKGIKELVWPSYYDLSKWLGFIEHQYYDSYWVLRVVLSLRKMEKEGIIIGSGGYWIKGTHSGAGAKKWEINEKVKTSQTHIL